MTRNEAVGEVVKRLVDHYRPERIYLFGSTARGEARAGSDLDFLVVLPDDTPRAALFDGTVYERLWGIPLAVDVIPFRRSEFEERSGWLMSLPAIALREGKLALCGVGSPLTATPPSRFRPLSVCQLPSTGKDEPRLIIDVMSDLRRAL